MKLNKLLLTIQKYLPAPIWNFGANLNKMYLKDKYLKGGRPYVAGETTKARPRRLREDFFNKYCNGAGLDIGFGGDIIKPDADGWDFEHGNAQYLEGVKDNTYDYVYSSHTLEHVDDAAESLRNWFRVLKPGGYLIIYIPHRDFYEKKKKLPSRFNVTHRRFFLPEEEDLPDTVGLLPLLKRTLKDYEVIYCKECSEGHTIKDPDIHSDGEYSIEAVIKKL